MRNEHCVTALKMDPLSVNAAVAVVSAAAGAASQVPKIQELERELEIAKLALTEVRYGACCRP